MKWDKKLTALAAAVVALVIAGTVLLVVFTNRQIGTAADRIAGAAELGFTKMTARITERTSDVWGVSVAKSGRFEGQEKYRAFDPAWLRELEFVPGEYLPEDVNETYRVSFRLKTYDTENVYSHRDTPVAYTRYDDTVVMLKERDEYYVTYEEDGAAYYFIVTCAPLTVWLDAVRD